MCRKQYCWSEMQWIFSQPCILPFPLGCIFLCPLFLRKILTISGTPKLSAVPAIVAGDSFFGDLCIHYFADMDTGTVLQNRMQIQLPQANAQ